MAPPSAVLSTRAVYSFTGFPGQPDCHLYLHHDGYPTGAAWRFARTLQAGGDLDTFALTFLSNQPKAEPLARPEQAADAEYRYLVQRLGRSQPRLQVQCWRRIPGNSRWYPRCTPINLSAFIQRFLPGELPC